jgi:peptidoglycan hydrolase-like amidase
MLARMARARRRRAIRGGSVVLIACACVAIAIVVARGLGRRHRPPRDPRAPATIRVWRRAVDGSTSSCLGRVDTIPFEDYVKGVLPHEWVPAWHPEALKAGAIAIRTYAAFWVSAGGKYECADLDDTTASQVYRDDLDPRTSAAVDATAGVYLVRDGALVLAEYSAENGDPTADGIAEPLCVGQPIDGHRRGACQRGTQRWALVGKSYQWIVDHYYPGASRVELAPIGER